MEDTDLVKLEDPEKDLSGGFILGPADFVQWVKGNYLSLRSDEKEIPELKRLKPAVEVSTVVDSVADEFGCSRDRILSKGSKKNMARDVAIYLARDLTGESGVNLGRFFGNISGAGITVRYNHLLKALEGNKRLKGKVNRIRRKIIKIKGVAL